MATVLLCTLNSKYIHTNLATRLLYQLNKQHPGLEWKEFTIKEDKEKIAETCARFDIVAFSCYIWNISHTLEVCRLIKARNPAITILLGGPEVSYDYNNVILRPEVDYIIAGEGESAFTSFLTNFPDVTTVPNLVCKKGTTIQSNPAAPAFDLKQLQHIMPYADDDAEVLRNKVLYIETSRGCPYKCEFCLASLDNKVRYLPDASIKATLLHLMQHGRTIKFLDRTFNIKKDFTLGIFQFILDHHRPGNVFQFEITADILHPDIIAFIREKVPQGLFRFEIGIQTVNQKANLAVSRKQNFEKTKNIILQLRDRVEMHLDLIVGLPHDSISEIRHSFMEVFALHPPELQLGFLKFLKGTPVRDKHREHGYVFDENPPYQLIESNFLSKEELNQISLLEEALESYWNSGRARNSLKYLSTTHCIFDLLIELGKIATEKGGFRHLTLEQAFALLHEFVSAHTEDRIAADLAAIDYYLHYKLRPGLLFGAVAAEGSSSDERCAALNIGFDYFHFLSSGSIRPARTTLVFCYNGENKCQVLQTDAAPVSAS